MKKFIVFPLVTLLALAIPAATAAPKVIAMQVGSIFNAPQGTESFQQSGKNSVYIANTVNPTRVAGSADITLTAIDLTGVQSWQRIIEGGGDEVTTASIVDVVGNIWLAGAASTLPVVETQTPITGIESPDGVQVLESQTVRAEMKNLALWKISSTGELVGTYLYQLPGVPLVSAISVNSNGITLVGAINAKPFVISSSLTGEFGKLAYIGSQKSALNAVIRNLDGSANLFGSSSETLGGKKVAGVRDGVLIKVSKSGAITSVVRSSAKQATRSWSSADSSFLLSGSVITGKKIETAITKFTTAFAPTWTARYASSGISIATSGGGNSYLAFTTKSTIAGVAPWKATQPTLVILTYDAKGAIKAAHSFPGLQTPLNLHYTRERGVVGLASASDGAVMIFTLASR